MKIALRIIASPFVFMLIFISYNFHCLRQTWFFLRYGGEWNSYSEKTNPKTIGDVYNEIVKCKTIDDEKTNLT